MTSQQYENDENKIWTRKISTIAFLFWERQCVASLEMRVFVENIFTVFLEHGMCVSNLSTNR